MSAPFPSDPESKPRVVAQIFRSFHLGRKLYVGNLSYNVADPDLEALFTHFGAVQSAQVIMDRDTGRSKGFGFVEMENESDALAAIDGLKEHEYDGRRLNVSEAKPREDRAPASSSRGGGGGGRGGYGGRRY